MEPKLLKKIEASSGDINYCSFSPSGATLASAGGEGLVRLWRVDNGSELECSPLRGHSERFYVNVCEFSPDGSLLATAGSDNSVKLWDVNTWKEKATLLGHQGAVRSCVFSPNGKLLLTSSAGGTAILWEVASQRNLATYKRGDSGVAACCFSFDGVFAFTGETSGDMCAWDTRTGGVVARTSADDLGVNCMRAAPSNLQPGSDKDWRSVVVTCGNNPEVKAWLLDYIKNKYVFTKQAVMKGHSSAVYVCRFNEHFSQCLTGSADKSVILWQVGTWTILWRMQAHARYVTCCAFSPDMRLLATTSSDKMLKMWDITGGKVPADCYTADQKVISEKQTTCMPSQAISEVCDWLTSVAGQPSTHEQDDAVQRLTEALQNFSK